MAEPATRKTNTAGGKYYVIDGDNYDSVTTALGVIDKQALIYWATGLSADLAFELLPQMIAASGEPPCGNSYNRCYEKHGRENRCERCACGQCQDCVTRRIRYKHDLESSRRAQEGTELHEAVNSWVTMGGTEISMRSEVRPYFDRFLEFVAHYDLTPKSWSATEATVYNSAHRYAGTTDGVIEIPWYKLAEPLGAPSSLQALASIRVDYKTREKPDPRIYSDIPLQLVGYDRCPLLLLPDSSTVENPTTDGQAVLQLRPDGYLFRVWQLTDEDYQQFLNSLSIYRYLNGRAKGLIAVGKADRSPPVVPAGVVDVELPEAIPEPPAIPTFLGVEPAQEVGGWPPVAEIPAEDPWIGVDAATKDAVTRPAATGKPSQTAGVDPFALAGNAKQKQADAAKVKTAPPRQAKDEAKRAEPQNPIMRSIAGLPPLKMGPAQLDLLEEALPF